MGKAQTSVLFNVFRTVSNSSSNNFHSTPQMSNVCHCQRLLVNCTRLHHTEHSTYINRLDFCAAAASRAIVMVNRDLARRPSDRAGCAAKAAIRRASHAAVLARLSVSRFVRAKALAGVVGAFRVGGASHKEPVGFHSRGDGCEGMGCQSEGCHDGNGREMHDCGGSFP